MVPADQSERLTFTAPSEPGEYPYVCTFPRHWMRMYGVMIVVDDLDAYAAAPFKPKDPIGSNRDFVKSWKLVDFDGELPEALRGRSPEIERNCSLRQRVPFVTRLMGRAAKLARRSTVSLPSGRGINPTCFARFLSRPTASMRSTRCKRSSP